MNDAPVEKKVVLSSNSKDADDLSTLAKRSNVIEKRKSMKIGGVLEVDEMSGYLHKRRGGFGRHMPNAWQIRYFTLRDGMMYYYEDSGADAKPRGKVDLRSENCDFMNGVAFEGAPTPFTMQILPGGWDEKWKLCAANKEDMELWVAAIMKHITDERKRVPAPLNLKSYASSDDEEDDTEAVDDDGPHLKIRGIAVSGGNSVVPKTTPDLLPANELPNSTRLPNENNSIGASTTTSSNLANPIPVGLPSTSPQVAPVQTSKGGKGKRKLKLDTTAESDELEYVLALVILNMCFVFGYLSTSLPLKLFYMLFANIVVARTLTLRTARLTQQIAATTKAVAAATAAATAAAQESIASAVALAQASSSEQLPHPPPLADGSVTPRERIGSVYEESGPPVPGTPPYIVSFI